MAIRHIIARGVGASPTKVGYIVTHGFGRLGWSEELSKAADGWAEQGAASDGWVEKSLASDGWTEL